MKAFSIRGILIIFTLLLSLTISIPVMQPNQAASPDNEYDFRSIVKYVDDRWPQIQEHMRFFASLGTRVTGYNGCEIAADYIYNKFLEYGLENVHFQYFNITVPIDYGAEITILSPVKKVIKAYPLWPNVVQTCPVNASGCLIYGGKMGLEELNGTKVSGSFVLADFNSHDNWLNVAKFGAKGVIFIEPSMTTVSEAKQKILDIPLNFPRLWISKEDGAYLLKLLSESGGKVLVHVKSKMVWKKVTAKNIIGMINGTVYGYNLSPNGTITYKKLTASQINTPQELTIPHYEAISITAHYDSFSCVPSLAPGADDSAGISALLEFANYFSKNRPRRTIIFIAFAGFWEGLFGSRTYVDENFGVEIEGSTNRWDLTRIHFNLDYSSDVNTLGLMYVGNYYGAWSTRWTDCPLARASTVAVKVRNYYAEIVKQLGKKYPFYDAVVNFWSEFSPIPYMLDIEPFMLAGSTALAFRTAKAWRAHWNTPFDTIDRVIWENLKPQVELSLCFLVPFANDDHIQRAYPLYRENAPFNFGSLIVQVVEYSYQTGWYVPVPNALVHVRLMAQEEVYAPGGVGTAPSSPYLQDLVVMTDENGTIRIPGVASCTSTFEPIIWIYSYDAFILDPDTGKIIYATDQGVYGAAKFPLTGSIDIEPMRKTIPVFSCGSLVLFDFVDPSTFVEPWRVELLTMPGYTVPFFYGGVTSTVKPIALLFLKPGETYLVKMTDNQYNLIGLLTNSSDDHPEGSGFTVDVGETVYVCNTLARASQDLYRLDNLRYQSLSRYGIGDVEAYKNHNRVAVLLKEIDEALNNGRYLEAYSKSFTALQLSIKVYSILKDLTYGGIFTITVMFMVALPTAFLVERLLLSLQGLKRLAGIIISFTVILFALTLVHPAFRIAYNVPLALLGTGVTVLLIPVLWIAINYSIKFFAKLRKKMLGAHIIETGRISSFGLAISLGIENMRRRKLRSSLTLITLILMVFSMVTFTSASSLTVARFLSEPGVTLYNGVYLRRAKLETTNPLTWEVYEFIRGMFPEATVVPRLWYYPERQTLTILFGEKNYTITMKAAIMALSPAEEDLLDMGGILTPGSTWFFEGDKYSVIISDQIAQKLGIKVGDTVNILGLDLLVRGIFYSEALGKIVDLDQKPILPLDILAPEEEQIMLETRVPAWGTIIVPLSLGKSLNFQIFTISAKIPGDPQELIKKASE
ncbi:MAG: hypothetical protein DRN78_01925, partial [Thermoproteota archaeon]